MNVILFDDPAIRMNLLPFTFTRPVASIITGIFTIAEKWEKILQVQVSFSTEGYLQEKFPLTASASNLWINGAVCPNDLLVKRIGQLSNEEGLLQGNSVIALRTPEDEIPEVITAKMI